MVKQYMAYCLPLLLIWLPFHDCGYLVLAPKAFRRDSPMLVSVGVEGAFNQVNVAGVLKSQALGSNTQYTADSTVISGATTNLVFNIPFTAPEGSYELTVTGSGGLTFSNKTTLQRLDEDALILIQTDKGIYKPGQVVKMRILGIGDDYKVVKRPITVSILDKNNNNLAKYTDKTDNTGVVRLEYPLSDEPPLGDWTIHAEMDGGSVNKNFKVDEYVLPKFEVTTELSPNYAIYGKQNQITVKVKAIYTYGKNVVGKCKVTMITESMTSEKTVDITGSIDVVFTLEEMLGSDTLSGMTSRFYYMWQERKIDISVNVTETATQFSITDEASAKVYSHTLKIILEPLNENNIYHKGLPANLRVRVTDPSGKPLTTYGMTVKVTLGGNTQDVVVNDAAGTVISFDTSAQENDLYIYATFADKKLAAQANVNLRKFGVDGTTVMQVADMNGETSKHLDLGSDKIVSVKVKSTGALSLMSYLVLSKGKITASGFLDFTNNMEQTLDITGTADMSPKATLLVYGVTSTKGKEVIVDVFDLIVDNGMKNKVTLDFSSPELAPNSDVGLTVTCDPQSDVFVLGVDKSVSLLATGNDLTKEALMEDFSLFTGEKKEQDNNRPQIMFRKKRSLLPPYSTVDADTILKATGLKYLTDIHIAKPFPTRIFLQRANAGACLNCDQVQFASVPMSAGNPQPPLANGVGGTSQKLSPVTHVRKFFPETWLWLHGKTSLNGDVSFASKVPDTITSWIATAFSISPVNGLGLTSTAAKLNAFQPFFISLNLPYTIVRGENFELIAAVNNYLAETVSVRVTLERSDDFAVLSVNSINEEFVHEEMVEEIQVNSQSTTSVYFRIQPKKLGDIIISAKAQPRGVSANGDQVKKTVIVKPEGFKMMNNTVLSVDMSEMTLFEESVDIWYPQSVVQGSRRVEVKVTGDVMGPALEGLDSLLQVPNGCGEQNMIGMVPNIFVADYLTNVGKITSDIEKRAVANMQRGYQRELNYRHSDGAFSAFGESDESGSTWLSAYVLKSFSQASKFITVEKDVQSKTFTWLSKQLKSNGQFDEPGRVIHTDMLGGAATGNKGLTAYVLTAMLESVDFIEPSLFNSAKAKTIGYLEGLVDKDKINQLYDKAIIAYALTLAKSEKAAVLLKQIEDGEEKPWTNISSEKKSPVADGKRFRTPHPPKATASDVETSAYILLAYTKNMDIAKSSVIVKWLMSQQNSNGGFYSTQDTVIGLQALSAYAELTFSSEKDLTVDISAGALSHTYNVNKDNALILKTFILSADTTNVNIKATGVGMAIVKVVWRYYSMTPVPSLLPMTGENKAPIVLTVSTKRANTHSSIVTCVKCQKDIGMSLITIDIPSGHEPNNMEDLKKDRNIKRTEYKDNAVNIYLDKIPAEETCYNIEMLQTQVVENLQDVPIKAMSYYQTEIETSVLYNIDETSKDYCEMCKGNRCIGCPTTSTAATRWSQASVMAVAVICLLLSLIFAI